MSAPLRGYQTTGVSWLCDGLLRHRAVLLCDDMGLGKTRQALAAADQLQVLRVLVVCPAGARHVWSQEIIQWLPAWRGRIFIIEPGTSQNDIKARLADPRPLVLVFGFDEMSNSESRLPGYLQRLGWDLLIIDEAHYLKNPSNRTKALYGSAGSDDGVQIACRYVILLTGTPTPNHAGELYQHVRTFWPHTITLPQKHRPMNQVEFEERFTKYSDTVYGRQVSGSKNQARLRSALAEVVLRRRKQDVLPELPPLVLQDIPLEPPPPGQTLTGPSRRLANRLVWSLSSAPDEMFIKALQTPDQQLSYLRRELGELKVAPTITWVQERMLSASKLLLFAWHHSVIEHLRRGLAEFDPVVVTGETSPVGRSNAIDLFQNRRSVRLFIGQLLAAGTAITLTAANEVAIVEPSWVPGENVQAICRAHRMGQRDSVLASFLYLPGTLDERIMATFRRKAREISELQGDNLHGSTDQPDLRHTQRRRTSAPAATPGGPRPHAADSSSQPVV
jgi:SNF2 family DNA or RNA helicase